MKIEKKELEKLNELVSSMEKKKKEIGDLELRKQDLVMQTFNLSDELANIQVDLKNKYGDIEVSLKDGSYKIRE